MPRWTLADLPSLHGRSALVTGTGGLGLEDALALARAGADVMIAGRDARKGADAVARVRSEVPAAKVTFEQVDLGDLRSIAALGTRLRDQRASLDLLINNAAVMNPPTRQQTSDGLELQLGTNHLGHFALTGHLLPLLRAGTRSRVVSLSSVAARDGRIDLDDLLAERAYAPMRAYSQSKLACLMFALELHRRSTRHGWGVTSVAAHPGISRTDLLHNAPGRWSLQGMARTYLWFLFQPAAMGALPTLYAATSPDVKPGGYYGPDGISEIRGYPSEARVPPQAEDVDVSARLWEASERLTGVRFPDA